MPQRLEFTPEIQAALQEERYHHPIAGDRRVDRDSAEREPGVRLS